jgi:hypothetical protein
LRDERTRTKTLRRVVNERLLGSIVFSNNAFILCRVYVRTWAVGCMENGGSFMKNFIDWIKAVIHFIKLLIYSWKHPDFKL